MLNSPGMQRAALTLALAVLVFGGISIPFKQTVTAPCRVEPIEAWHLEQSAGGDITGRLAHRTGPVAPFTIARFERPDFIEIRIEPSIIAGAKVTAGDTVATIHSIESKRSLGHAAAELSRAHSTAIALEAGARYVDVTVAERELERASAELSAYRFEYDRAVALHDSGHISQSELDKIQGHFNVLLAEKNLALAKIEALKAGQRPQDIDIASAAIERERADLISARETVKRYSAIITPIGGIVKPNVAAVPATRGGILTVERNDTMAVVITVSEGVLSQIGDTTTADIVFPSLGKEAVTVHLTARGYFGEPISQPWLLGFIPNPAGRLMNGMTGRAVIALGNLTVWDGIKLKLSHR